MIKAAVALLIVFGLSISVEAEQDSLQSLPSCPSTPVPQNMVRPRYPKDALRRGTAGTVELRSVITSDAKTKELTVLHGDPEFSKSAQDAIRRWRFHPVVRQGHAVETIYKIDVRFDPLLREANSDVELESPQSESAPVPSPFMATGQSPGEEVHRASEPGVVSPKPIYQPEPEFSEASRKKGEQGNVNIALVVGTDGLPRDLKVICSSIPDSDQNAIEAVKQWRFSPATKDGNPVAVAIVIEVSFKRYN